MITCLFARTSATLPRWYLLGLFVLLFGGALAQEKPDYNALLQRAEAAVKEGKSLEAERIIAPIITTNDNRENLIFKGRAHRLIASVRASHSRKAEEIEHLFKSYWFFTEAGENREEAEAQRLIGQFYLHMKLPDEADRYLKNALKISTNLNDTIIQLKVISNQAQLSYSRENNDQALKLFEQAILLSQKIKWRQGLLENWNRMAYAYWKKGDPKKMLVCMKNSLSYITTNTDTLGIIYGDLGLAFMENELLDSADWCMQKGLKYIKESENIQQEMILYKHLYKLKVKQRNEKEALVFLELYNTLRDKLFTKELKQEVSFAEERHIQMESVKRLDDERAKGRTVLLLLVIALILLIGLIFILVRFRNINRATLKQKRELDSALQQLHKSEDLYKQLFESNMGLVITHTLQGIITSANKAVLKLFEIEREEIIGRTLQDFIHHEYKHLFTGYLEEIIEKKESSGLLTVQTEQGNKRILHYQNNIVLNAEGEPYVIGFSQDQTDFFNAQMLASQSSKRLSLIMEHSPDTYSILDREGVISYINHSSFDTPEQLIGRNIFEFLDGEQATDFYRQVIAAFDSSKVVESEEKYKDKYFLTKLIPLVEGGAVRNLLSINTDITRLKENEAELKKLSSIVEETTNMVMVTDVNGVINWVNRSFERITGYKKEEAIGKKPSRLLQGHETDMEVVSHMSLQIKKQASFECELINYSKSGKVYWVRITAQPIIDSGGKFKGHFSVQQDITQERELMSQLTLAKEEAEESNRLKTIFLGSLSHEVRTPLQGILGFAEILETPGISEDKRTEYLNIIKRRTYDMQNIIESLLDMASLETGEIKAFPVVANLNEFIETSFTKVKQDNDLTGKSIQLILENKLPKDAMATIDVQHLHQVLINLLRNAIKFTNQGTIKLTFERRQHFFQVSITDTGIGIAPDKIEHIFKPFRQAHEGLSRSKGGIGLGLSICKKMIEIWEGSIDVTSELGKGSTFSFTIPIK